MANEVLAEGSLSCNILWNSYKFELPIEAQGFEVIVAVLNNTCFKQKQNEGGKKSVLNFQAFLPLEYRSTITSKAS